MKTKIGSILLLSLIITSCSGDNNNEYIEESGTIEATESIISSQVSGKVLSINKDEGSNVSEGDTLLIIDHELYEIQLLQANAGRDIAKAQYDLLVKGARSEDIKSSYEMLIILFKLLILIVKVSNSCFKLGVLLSKFLIFFSESSIHCSKILIALLECLKVSNQLLPNKHKTLLIPNNITL